MNVLTERLAEALAVCDAACHDEITDFRPARIVVEGGEA